MRWFKFIFRHNKWIGICFKEFTGRVSRTTLDKDNNGSQFINHVTKMVTSERLRTKAMNWIHPSTQGAKVYSSAVDIMMKIYRHYSVEHFRI